MIKPFAVYTTDINNPRQFATLTEATAWVDEQGVDATIFSVSDDTLVASKNRDACDGAWMYAPGRG
jgi:hypothetical protein